MTISDIDEDSMMYERPHRFFAGFTIQLYTLCIWYSIRGITTRRRFDGFVCCEI